MALNNVPLSGQTLSVTRVPINQNFSVIDTAFSEDHVDYNIAGQGQHNKVSFPTQNPVPAPQAGICQLYSQISAITNQPELVFTHQAGSTAPNPAKIVEFTSAGWANPGWTRLPSGILLKWNEGVATNGSNNVTVDVDVVDPTSPPFTNIYTAFAILGNLNIGETLTASIVTIGGSEIEFGIYGPFLPSMGSTLSYLVIGV